MGLVILARHGRTEANTAGVLAGRSKGVHLDELGRQQAASAGERLAGLPLAAVVSSPLERCRETARAIAAAQAVPPSAHVDRGLLECDYGEWTGKKLGQLAKEPLWRTVQTQPAAAVFPGGESLAGMAARGVEAVRRWDARLTAEHGEDVAWVVVSHGDVIKAILADALGMHLDAFQRIVVDPASLSLVRYTGVRPFVLATNTTSGGLDHLKPPPRKGRARRTRKAQEDAVVGGGAGPGGAAGRDA